MRFFTNSWPNFPWRKTCRQANYAFGAMALIVEALNCLLRQRCGVLVRKSYSFSKSLAMHPARIKFIIDKQPLPLK